MHIQSNRAAWRAVMLAFVPTFRRGYKTSGQIFFKQQNDYSNSANSRGAGLGHGPQQNNSREIGGSPDEVKAGTNVTGMC